ncbi:hypothetical protein Tco_0586077 [Tanacetum coccineum]
MMVQANQEEGVDSGIPTDSQQTLITTQPSSSRPQKKQSKRKQRKETEVLDLEKAKDAQAKEIAGLKKRVQKLERKKKSRTTGLKRLRKFGKILEGFESSRIKASLDDLHGDEVIVDMAVGEKQEQSAKVDEREVNTAVKDSDAPTIPVTTADEGVTADKIDEFTPTSAPTTVIDELTLAQTLIEIKAAKPKVVTTAAITRTTRPKARGVGRSYDEIQKMFDKEMKRVNSFVAMNSEAQEISRKKDESSSKKTEIAQDSSAKRAGDKLESDKSEKMLQGIDREDLETLWKLVKTKHGDTRPKDEHKRVLWGDLKVMFEPDIKSDVWRNLQGYKVTIWKLFDSCGVHFIRGGLLGLKDFKMILRVTAAGTKSLCCWITIVRRIAIVRG